MQLSRNEWKTKSEFVQKNGGLVKTVWGLGETFFYMPGKKGGYEMVAEVYDVGFERGSR